LHLLVRENLETFLATVREERGKDLPHYVEEELRRYLRCGLLCHGFVRVFCPECRQEILVGLSCKCRGTCPSCGARRMCGTAAHLVDHVLPDVPVRQWVLTAPFEVRRVLALRPEALTACNRLFVEEIARWQKDKAKALGTPGGETGSVTFVQRFNATLGSFVHFHVVALDGVFTRTNDGVVFHDGPAPTREEIAAIAGRVAERMTRWLRRRRLLEDRPAEERSNEAPDLSPIEACMQASLFGGTFLRLGKDGTPLADENDQHRAGSKSPWAAEVDGFNVHGGVVIHKGNRDGLERLCRYGARPPFSLERLSILADGRVAYSLRKPRKNGATHLVLTPEQALARISALVPPPRYPLVRFAGVLAPGSSWRALVVPRGALASSTPVGTTTKKALPKQNKSAKPSPLLASALAPAVDPANSEATKSRRPLLCPEVARPVYARIDWASLLKRTYLEDVLACPCGGRRRLIADISEPDVIVAILSHLGLPTEPPPLARARGPTWVEPA
jgi:hypothetical protein